METSNAVEACNRLPLLPCALELRSGQRLILRLLQPQDAAPFGDYLLNLSAHARSHFAPHEFTRERAEQVCADANAGDLLRFVVTAGPVPSPCIVAYFLLFLGEPHLEIRRYEQYGDTLAALRGKRLCTFAPSVADDYQSRGLASAAMPKILELARALGCEQMLLMGGAHVENAKAVAFYEKFGFRPVGRFMNPDGRESQDMMMDLKTTNP